MKLSSYEVTQAADLLRLLLLPLSVIMAQLLCAAMLCAADSLILIVYLFIFLQPIMLKMLTGHLED